MATIPPTPKRADALHPLVLLAIGLVVGIALTWSVIKGPDVWKAYNDPVRKFLAKNRSDDPKVIETASGLQYKILSPGKGAAKPTDADIALVNYEGKLTDGTTFDKSQQPTPMKVTDVVPGFSEALKLMPKGSKYRFWLKPSLGYGEKVTGPIPAHSILVFDVELIDFLPESVIRQMQMQQQQMMQQQGGAPGGGMPPGVGGPPGAGAPPAGAPTGK